MEARLSPCEFSCTFVDGYLKPGRTGVKDSPAPYCFFFLLLLPSLLGLSFYYYYYYYYDYYHIFFSFLPSKAKGVAQKRGRPRKIHTTLKDVVLGWTSSSS